MEQQVVTVLYFMSNDFFIQGIIDLLIWFNDLL